MEPQPTEVQVPIDQNDLTKVQLRNDQNDSTEVQFPSDQNDLTDLLILEDRQTSMIENITQKLSELERKVQVLRIVKGLLEGTGNQQAGTNVVRRNRTVQSPVKPFLQLVLLIFLIPLIILFMGYLFFMVFPKITPESTSEFDGTAFEKAYSTLELEGQSTTDPPWNNVIDTSTLNNLLSTTTTSNSPWNNVNDTSALSNLHFNTSSDPDLVDNLPVVTAKPWKDFDELTISPSPPFFASVEKNLILERTLWGGKYPVRAMEPLDHPVPLVIVMHTVTPMCTTFEECSSRVRNLQEFHVLRGYPDIGYNFLIGGDDNLYVGRGWDTVNYTKDKSISIAFIGNFLYNELTPGMIHVAKNLLEEGVKLNKISPDYKLKCHSETENTSSPEANVYKVVQYWPHFSAGSIFDKQVV